ncbi:MAG: glycosyltransferase [Bacteroidales bacterium]|jgi:glycosyltransferase involved in cell wall biosynthesis|nr:glycosyltransferase [Bacteroidales bacterium]
MKIAVLLSRVPYPLEKGDKLRAYHQIVGLSQRHEIFLIALCDSSIHPEATVKLRPFCKELHILKLTRWSEILNVCRAFFKGLPFQCGYFYRKQTQRQIDRILECAQPDVLYVQMVRVAEYVKNKNTPKVIDYQDVLSKGIHRRHEQAAWYLKPFFKAEFRRLLRYEKKLLSLFDRRIIITAVDRDLIPNPAKLPINIVPNGVDFERYSYHGETKAFDLIFTGNMSYPPNIKAAEYIVNQLIPILKKHFPQLTTLICGASPSPRIVTLARPGVTVTGWVDNMADYYAKSRIFLAPMQLGTGLQNKLLEAMSMRLPCVTSPLAGKPLMQSNSANNNFIVCNSKIEYIEAIMLLLTNTEKYNEIANNGCQFVRKYYNWETSNKILTEILEGVRHEIKL